MKEVLFVPGLKKNLLSISALDNKGYRVSFIDGKVLMWPKGKSIEDAVVIGEEEGVLYKLNGHLEKPMFMRPLTLVNYGTKGFPTSITKNYLM